MSASLEQQRAFVSFMLHSKDIMALVSPILNPNHFDPTLRKAVTFIQKYFNERRELPRLELVRSEVGQTFDKLEGPVTKAEVDFISKDVETFCLHKAVHSVILGAPSLIQTGEYSLIIDQLKEALDTSVQRDNGLDVFSDPKFNLEKLLEAQARISTGLPEVDALLGGGLGRQELVLFAANSGGGKSMNMLNLGYNLLKQGMNGVYISLEMAEHVVYKRFCSMATGIPQEGILKDIDKVSELLQTASNKMGKLIVKRMPENRTNVNHVRSYVQQLERSTGFKPDFIIIDYVDIMGTTFDIPLDNLFVKDKYVCEEIRSLGFDFDCLMISASQLGRGALEASAKSEKLHQGHIQGGISKINTADFVIGIQQTDAMKAAGEIVYEFMKTRNSNGVGKRVTLKWNERSLLVESLMNQAPKLDLKRRTTPPLSSENTIFNRNRTGDDPKASAIDTLLGS